MTQEKIKEISLNNEVYVLKSSIEDNKLAANIEGLQYVLVRSNRAGVHIGYLKSKDYKPAGTVVVLLESRNIYYWDGASGISQIAMEGVTNKTSSKITVAVSEREISEVIEIIPVTEKAKTILDSIVWKR